jgi:hypothetical protein
VSLVSSFFAASDSVFIKIPLNTRQLAVGLFTFTSNSSDFKVISFFE